MAVQFDIESFEAASLRNHLGDYWMRVSDQIHLLNRFVYLEWASARVIAGWLPAAAEFEWKIAMSKMMWHNMTIAERILTRKEELSSNRKIAIPSETLHGFIQSVSAADGYFPFVAGWFLELTRDQIRSYEQYMETLDPIFDAPTLEILQEVMPKKQLQLKWAVDLIHDAVHDPATLEAIARWRQYTKQFLSHIGGVDEQLGKLADKPACPIAEAYGPAPSKPSKPEWLKPATTLNPPKEFADNLKIFMWHYCTEITALDPMCYLFYGVGEMPFEFYVDLSRHIWDESRHHMMGVRRLRQMGFAQKDVPLPSNESALVSKDFAALYSGLTMIAESCSFTRKKKSMDAYYSLGDVISGMTAEIDIVDERSHVRFGKKWVAPLNKQLLGDDSSLEEIVRKMMKNHMAVDSEFSALTEDEKEKLSHFTFCGKIEFKNLNYDRI